MNPERKAYETSVKLPRWNGKTSLGHMLPDDATRRAIMRRVFPPLTVAHCEERASYHAGREMIARDNYRRAVRAAFGREPDAREYKISCVWRDDFSREHKARMQRWNDAANYHADMRRAFLAASKYRRAA